MALIDKASLLFVPSVVAEGKAFNILPSGNRAPDSTDQNSGYDQTRADFDFDRGSNAAATRVNADGLIEKYRENVLLQSNQFDTTWASYAATETGGQIGYDGTSNAWLLDKSAASGNVYQDVSISGVNTYSVYVKGGTNTWVALLVAGPNAGKFFNLSGSGAVGSNFVNAPVGASIESIGSGWFRISIITNASVTQVRIYPAESDGVNSGTSGNIYIQNAQVEKGLVASSYLESTSVTAKAGVLVDLPRINYDANGENGSLLLEPSRQNLIPQSEWFGSGSGWSLLNNVSIGNFVLSPEGKMNATELVFDGSANGRIERVISGLTSGADYSVSLYARVASGTQNVSFGSFEDEVFTLTTEWQRLKKTQPENDTNAYPRIRCNDAATIEIYGFQHEAGSYSSSYIPTMGTSETRAADSCSVTGASDVIGQSEGTIYLDIQTPDAIQSNTTFSIGGGTSSEYAQIEIRTDLSINWRYRVGGTDYINANVGSYSAGDRLKIAFGYKNGDSILYLNGSSTATDTGSIVSNSWDEVKYSNFADTGKLEASVYENILFNERLSNAELAALTA